MKLDLFFLDINNKNTTFKRFFSFAIFNMTVFVEHEFHNDGRLQEYQEKFFIENDAKTKIQDFIKNLFLKYKVYTINNLDIDPLGSKLIYFVLQGDNENIKILIFQENSSGEMKQLTNASDLNMKIFSQQDLNLHYKIIDFGFYEVKNSKLNLTKNFNEKNKNLIHQINKPYLPVEFVGQFTFKNIDNNFFNILLS